MSSTKKPSHPSPRPGSASEYHKPSHSGVSSSQLRSCRDGLDCILQDSMEHCSKYSHPCRYAHRCTKKQSEPHLTHEAHITEKCQYDENCTKIGEPQHRASFWHTGKPCYLRACREQQRCSNNSFDHRSKYSHGEYKRIFSQKPSGGHAPKNGDRRRSVDKSPNIGRRPRSKSQDESKIGVRSPSNNPGKPKTGRRPRSKSQDKSNTIGKPDARRRSISKGKPRDRSLSKTAVEPGAQRRSISRGISRSQSRSLSRGRSLSKGKQRTQSRSLSRGRSNSQGKQRTQSRSLSRGRSNSQGKSRTQSRSKSRDEQNEKNRLKDQGNKSTVSGRTFSSKSPQRTDWSKSKNSDTSSSDDENDLPLSPRSKAPKSILHRDHRT